MRFPLALLFLQDFSCDMPIIDVPFVNRDGLGTRTLELMTHYIVLHDRVLRATYRGLVAFDAFG